MYRTIPRRAAIAAGAVLLVLTSATADPTNPSTPQPTPAAADTTEPATTPLDFAFLAARAELAAKPRASRRTTQTRRPAARAARPHIAKPRSRPATTRSAATRDTGGDRRHEAAPRRGVAAVLAFARAQIGDPYVRNAAGPDAWDCSGLTMKAYGRAGLSLPHKAARQGVMGRPVARGAARAGDLVVWGTYHVGIYVGDGKVLHSPQPGRRVQIASIWGSPRFRRLL